MTPRERVLAAFAHSQPDFTPCDYYATPEIHEALLGHFGLTDAPGASRQAFPPMGGPGDNVLPERLGTDIRYIAPPYIGPPLPAFDDGSTMDLWGIRRRPMPNEFGEYAEPVDRPYAGWETVEQAAAFPWPNPDWFDYEAMPAICARYPDMAIAAGSFGVQDFINGVAFGRGVEQVLMDIAVEDPVYLYIVERRHRFYLEYIERILRAARGRIDLVLCGDDFRDAARTADLGGHVRPAVRGEEEGTVRPRALLRCQGHAPLLRLQPGPDPAVPGLRHGRAADDPAAGRRAWTPMN